MQKYILIVLVIALLVALFAVQNALRVDIRFLWWTFPQVSLVMIMLSSFTGSVFAGFGQTASLNFPNPGTDRTQPAACGGNRAP